MNGGEPIRVVIADDHTLFRDGLRALLASAPDTLLAGEAATGEEAVQRAAELQPDVILMDMQMPVLNGVEATRRIVRMSPHVSVLMVTMAAMRPAVRPGRSLLGWNSLFSALATCISRPPANR